MNGHIVFVSMTLPGLSAIACITTFVFRSTGQASSSLQLKNTDIPDSHLYHFYVSSSYSGGSVLLNDHDSKVNVSCPNILALDEETLCIRKESKNLLN